jgi:hypothetical protein
MRKLFLALCGFIIIAILLWTFVDVCEPLCSAVRPVRHLVGQELEPTEAAALVLRINGQEVTDAGIAADVGELIRLDLTDSTVDGITWQVLPPTPDFEVIEQGRRALLSGRAPGEFLLMMAGAKEGKAYLIYTRIRIRGEVPTPAPVSNLTRSVAEWMGLVAKYDDRETHARAMADVFRKLSTRSEIEVDKILEATALANSALLGENVAEWHPFLDRVGTELDELSEAGELDTREQYKTVWEEIASGIERGI